MAILGFPSTSIIDSTSAGRALLTAANAAAQRTLLGLGTGDTPTFTALVLAGQSLTGSSSTSVFDASTTWNTTGTPTAWKLNVTDISSPAASLLADLQIGGSSKFAVTKTSVGIGTNTPSERLHVSAAVSGNLSALIENTTTGNGQVGLKLRTNYGSVPATSEIYFDYVGSGNIFKAGRDLTNSQGGFNFMSNSGTVQMVLRTNSGDVGIGTTTPANRLHVYNSSNSVASFESAGSATVDIFRTSLTGIRFQAIGGSSQGVIGSTAGGRSITLCYDSSGGSITNGVGIGNTPVITDIRATLSVRSATTTARTVSIEKLASQTADLFVVSSDAAAYPDTTNIGNFFKITASGDVGIGTTSPVARLDIAGTADSVQLRVKAHTTQTNNIQEWWAASAALYTAAITPSCGFFTRAATAFEVSNGRSFQLTADSNTFNIRDGSAGVTRVTVGSTGNVGINNTSPTVRLDVAGTVEVKDGLNPQTLAVYNTYSGAGANYERGFIRWNNNFFEFGADALGTGNNRALRFLTNGQVRLTVSSTVPQINFGSNIAPPAIYCHTGSAISTAADGTGLTLYRVSGAANNEIGIGFYSNPSILTAGFWYLTELQQSFAPTSGTGTYAAQRINITVNQTGGANGIYRGIWVNPTLTAVADWRSIETSNNSGYAFYGAGTANSYFGGNVGIGNAAPGYALDISGTTPAIRVNNAAGNQRILVGSDGAGSFVGTFSNNDLRFFTNSAEVARITAAGSVGIGTASPSTLFEVSGANGSNIIRSTTTSNIGTTAWAGVTAHDIQFYNADPSGAGIYSAIRVIGGANSGNPNAGTADYDFTVWTGGYAKTLTERFRITSDGDIGIGNAAPSQKVHITGNLRVTGSYYDSNNSAGTSGQILASTGTGTDWVTLSEITGVDGSGTLNYVTKWTPDGNTIGNSQIFDNATNVGIGTTSPSSKLHLMVAGGSAGYGNLLQLERSGGWGVGWVDVQYVGSTFETFLCVDLNTNPTAKISCWQDVWDGGNKPGSIRFYTRPSGGSVTERVRITSTGDVGIATTSPSEKLHVVGNGYFVGYIGVNQTPSSFYDIYTSGAIRSNTAYIAASNTGYYSLGSSSDVILTRDAAGVLAQRNGVNAQTFRIYNTYTDASNYERGKFAWNSNVLEIGTEKLGTGVARGVAIQVDGTTRIDIPTSGDIYLTPVGTTDSFRFGPNGFKYLTSGGIISPVTFTMAQISLPYSNVAVGGTAGASTNSPSFSVTRTQTADVAASITNFITTFNTPASSVQAQNSVTVSTTVNQGAGSTGITRGLYVNPTLTAAADWRAIEVANGPVVFTDTYAAGSGSLAGSALTINQTFNTTGAPTAFALNITDTASATTGSTAAFTISTGGTARIMFHKSPAANGSIWGTVWITNNNNGVMVNPGSVTLGSNTLLQWTTSGVTSTTYSTPELVLAKDAANILAQRNGVNAQSLRVYNTYTDASNYERGKFAWSSNVLQIGTEALGTGTARDLDLQTNGITRFKLTAAGTGAGAVFSTSIEVGSGSSVGLRLNGSSTSSNDIEIISLSRIWRLCAISTTPLAGDYANTSPGQFGIYDGTLGLFRLLIGTTGNVGIGSYSPTARLHVKGSGNTSATFGINLEDSAGTHVFRVRDDGGIHVGPTTGSTNGAFISASDGADNIGTTTGSGLRYRSSLTLSNTGADHYFRNYQGSRSHTSGNAHLIQCVGGYAPTSGTGVYNLMTLMPTVNQTGGATGITRGLYIEAVLTAADDYRAIDTNNGVWRLNDTYGAGSGSLARPALTINQTWNTTGIPTAFQVNVTDTASNTDSLLMDLRTGGSSRFKVEKSGSAVVTTNLYVFGTGDADVNRSGLSHQSSGTKLGLLVNGVFRATASSVGIVVRNDGGYGFSPDGNASNTPDLILNRDAANSLAQRNGVNAQTLRVYNTYTDASNYERGKFAWSSNVLQIGTEKAGTGVARALEIQTDGTTRITVAATGAVTFNSAATFTSIAVTSSSLISYDGTSLSTTTATSITTFVAATYGSAEYLVQVRDTVTGQRQVSKILIVHDGTTAYSTEYGVVFTGTAALATFTVDISGGNVRLLAAGASANSTEYKILKTNLVV